MDFRVKKQRLRENFKKYNRLCISNPEKVADVVIDVVDMEARYGGL